jgi:hypothetical protein
MGFSPRNLSRSLPIDPHSPHACSTPRVYTFSITWTVLRLLTSLALGYSNRPDQKSPGSVTATGFLPGVLSFLCALSPLERDAHRPKPPVHPTSTPLSLGERESFATGHKPYAVQHCVATTTHGKQTQPSSNWFSDGKSISRSRLRNRDLTHRLDLGQWMHTDSLDTTRDFSVQNRGETDSFIIDHRLLVQYGGIHGFSESQTQTFRITGMHEGSLQNSGQSYCSEYVHAQAVRSNGRRNPSRSTLAILFTCTRVDTCHPGDCMHSTSMHHLPLVRNLGQKYKRHMFFWNNNKILFPGLSPLG